MELAAETDAGAVGLAFYVHVGHQRFHKTESVAAITASLIRCPPASIVLDCDGDAVRLDVAVNVDPVTCPLDGVTNSVGERLDDGKRDVVSCRPVNVGVQQSFAQLAAEPPQL